MFPGGCFFAAVASDLNTHPEATRDRVIPVLYNWGSLFRQCILDAEAAREIDATVEVARAKFETRGMLLAGTFRFVMTNDSMQRAQARGGAEHLLERLTVHGGG